MADTKNNSNHSSQDILELFTQIMLTPVNGAVERNQQSTSQHSDALQHTITPLLQTASLILDLFQVEPDAVKPATDNDAGKHSLDQNQPPSDGGDQDTAFNQLSKWIELGCEYNKRILTDTLNILSSPADRCNSMIDSFTSLSTQLLQSGSSTPANLIKNHLLLMQKQLELGENIIRRLAGDTTEPVIEPQKTDNRFRDEQWSSNILFDFVKQSYLLNSQSLMSITDCLDIPTKNKSLLTYLLRQVSSAMSPSNFALMNPEVLQKIKETNGKNIYQGIRQLLEDHSKSPQILNVCMSDQEKFQLGENIATAKGKVVFENELMQLIQYQATTKKTFSVPLLIIPSWINKYYILDLSPTNSFVQWAVNQGYTVFMISWVNPDQDHRHIEFDDYLKLGVLDAINAIKTITGESQVNAVGYCLGGILLATALSYLSHHKQNAIASATYLATSLDYTDPGDIGIFLNEKSVDTLEALMEKEGYLDGRLLSITFNSLRENDLYWNYYVKNYLKGERPKAFDVLHWNSDNTNVPAKAHSFVLRDLHLNNGLMNENSVSLLNTPMDLQKVKNPTYILATDKDHIAKWQSAYTATQLHSGDRRFVLAGSGHIAGVINPPTSKKYYYLVNPDLPPCPNSWLNRAKRSEGSWWNDWIEWLHPHGGKRITARKIDDRHVIEDAPGRYVLKRLN